MFNFTNYLKSDVELMLKAANTTTRDIKRSEITQAQKKLIEVSKYIYILKDILNEDILKMTRDVEFLEFKENEIIFEDGEESDEIYFLLRGLLSVDIKKGGEYREIAQIKPLELFGEMAFISKKPRSARIRSIRENSTIIKFVIDEGAYEPSICHAFMKLYKNIASVIVKKLEASNDFIHKGD